MSKVKFFRIALAAIIAAGIAKVTFAHSVHMAETHGQTHDNAIMYPIIIDAVMLYCSASLQMPGTNRGTRFWCRAGLYLGIAFSVAANLLSTDATDTINAAVAVVPAVMLFVMTEVTLASTKSVRAGQRRRTVTKQA